MQINWLVLLLAVPLIGAVVCAFIGVGRTARAWALLVSLVTLVISLIIAYGFHYGTGQMLFGYVGPRLEDVDISFKLGIDSIALFLILLTTGLTPLAIAASFGSIRERQKEYYAWMLALLAAMIGVFCARDLLLFYVFFELTLVPMFFIIGIWGGPERRYAAAKFFLFTFAGSVFTLAAAIYLGLRYDTFDLTNIVRGVHAGLQFGDVFMPPLTSTEQFWILLGFLAGFAVKVPLFPVHTWLPLAHTEAPTAGSVILAGVLLKLGTYGLLRLALPIGMVTNDGSVAQPEVITVLGVLCLVGIIYGALVAWVQQDIKKLVAYSSVSHLGFCVLGLIALNTHGVQGSILYMINHGISTGAMFLVIGMIYERKHTRMIEAYGGIARVVPVFAALLTFVSLSSIGLPGTNGFIGEFLVLLGAFRTHPILATVATTGVIFAAAYLLWAIQRMLFNPLDKAENERIPDLNRRELALLAPLIVAIVWLGVYPAPVLRRMEASATRVVRLVETRATEARAQQQLVGMSEGR